MSSNLKQQQQQLSLFVAWLWGTKDNRSRSIKWAFYITDFREKFIDLIICIFSLACVILCFISHLLFDNYYSIHLSDGELMSNEPSAWPRCSWVPHWAPQIIGNGNRTEWSPIRSVIIRVINKIGRPRSGSPICLITSMITDRIGRH